MQVHLARMFRNIIICWNADNNICIKLTAILHFKKVNKEKKRVVAIEIYLIHLTHLSSSLINTSTEMNDLCI